LATCPNRDYCTISDQGRVLRLGLGAPFYCPECSHALVRAPDRRRRRQIHWPNVAASIIGGVAVAAAAAMLLRPAARQHPATAEPALSRFTWLPDPSLAALRSATIGLFPPSGSDEPAPRHRRINGPRVDRASVEATADLRAGIPVAPAMNWHDDGTSQALAMPWRQALIMAALMTPSQPSAPRKGAGAGTDSAALGTRLPFTRPLAPPPRPTEDTARTLLAGVLTPIKLPAKGGAANPFRVAYGVPPARAGLQAAAAPAPPKSRAARPADRRAKPAAHVAAEKKPTPPPAAVAQKPPVAAAIHADADAADPAPPAPHRRVVMLPATARFSYAPLKDVNFPKLPPRFFMSSRATADKPKQGSLQVDCAIETTGVPSDCHVMNAKNAAAVSDALLAWLGSGMVHYTPKTEDGHPVRSRRTLTLDFPAEAARNTP
jgi:hypothetical protein